MSALFRIVHNCASPRTTQTNESVNSLLKDFTNPQLHSPVSPVSPAPFERILAPVSLRLVPNRSSPVYVNHIRWRGNNSHMSIFVPATTIPSTPTPPRPAQPRPAAAALHWMLSVGIKAGDSGDGRLLSADAFEANVSVKTGRRRREEKCWWRGDSRVNVAAASAVQPACKRQASLRQYDLKTPLWLFSQQSDSLSFDLF